MAAPSPNRSSILLYEQNWKESLDQFGWLYQPRIWSNVAPYRHWPGLILNLLLEPNQLVIRRAGLILNVRQTYFVAPFSLLLESNQLEILRVLLAGLIQNLRTFSFVAPIFLLLEPNQLVILRVLLAGGLILNLRTVSFAAAPICLLLEPNQMVILRGTGSCSGGSIHRNYHPDLPAKSKLS